MTEKTMEENGKFYQFYDGDRQGPWIDKRRGAGKVLAHLIANKGRLVSLEEIEEVSGWRNPKKQMRGFIFEINGWSPYHLTETGQDGEISYILNERSLNSVSSS